MNMFSSAARTFKVTFPTLAPDPVHIDSDTCIGSNVCQSDLMERVTGHYLQLVTSLVETSKWTPPCYAGLIATLQGRLTKREVHQVAW